MTRKDVVIPNLEWCLARSRELGTPWRCPFASVESCPKYYQSVSLLGNAGFTGLTSEEDARLQEKWQGSDLWPKTDEQAPGVYSSEDGPKMFVNFCPEVAFDSFGYFASSLSKYSDELDRDIAHERLGEVEALSEDWRWTWAQVSPMHYTECPLYSILDKREGHNPEVNEGDKQDPVLDLRPNVYGLGVNVRALANWFRRWFPGDHK